MAQREALGSMLLLQRTGVCTVQRVTCAYWGTGLLPGAGLTCVPTSRSYPDAGGGSAGPKGGRICWGRGGLAIPSLPSMGQHKLAANSDMRTVL